MRTETLIERLSRDLRPVRPRSWKRDGMIVLTLGIAELAVFLSMGFMRPNMPMAMTQPSFWWKLVGMGLIAALGTLTALLSLNPARSPRRGLCWMLALIALIFASGWLIDAGRGGFGNLVARIDWRDGIQCSAKMIALSIPPGMALALLIRRGAPADGAGTALAGSLAAAGWGAFIFVFACPYDDPLYIAVWYTLGCGLVSIIGRIVLSRLARW